MERIRENLYLLFKGNEKNCNVFALKGKDTVLIDCGIPEFYKEIIGNMEFFNLPYPSFILITHCHFDHSLSAYIFEKNGSKIIAHEKTAEALEKNTYMVWPENVSAVKRTKVEMKIKGDTSLNIGGIKIDFIHTPGHTSGSSSFLAYLNGEKYLFTGDLILEGGKVGWKGSIGFDLEKLKESLEKIKKIDFDLLLPGHGKWFTKEEGKEFIEEALKNTKNPL
ncbi:MAG TPA: MBL fold metallo-hydrolase [bacterium]|nr:MBL fold metallo-hydrolase [bacterium]